MQLEWYVLHLHYYNDDDFEENYFVQAQEQKLAEMSAKREREVSLFK